MIPTICIAANIQAITLNRNLNYGQDFSTCGEGIDDYGSFKFIVIADGHGNGKYVEIMSSNNFKWNRIISQSTGKDMLEKLHKQIEKACNNNIDKINSFENDGSTLSIVKIYKNMIKCFWIGDSQIRIFKNKKEWFKSKNHTAKNKKELTRLEQCQESAYNIKKVKSLFVADPHTLTKTYQKQIHFYTNNTCEKMNITRALGHNNALHPIFQIKTLFIDEEDIIDIVAASDGFWDMYCETSDHDIEGLLKKSAKDLAFLALQRWQQSWNYKNTTYTLPTSECDDISIAIFRNKSIDRNNIIIN